MYGECESCGNKRLLDCHHNIHSGQELYLCDECGYALSDEDKRALANTSTNVTGNQPAPRGKQGE